MPRLYFDLGSPYAYLAVERADGVLGACPELEPVLLGAIFAMRGRGSWSQTDARAVNVEEVECRARRYGLPAIAWPPGWPPDTLAAMRAATWAKRLGRGDEFARAAFRQAFARGRDVADLEVLRAAAGEAGLPADELAEAVSSPEVKGALRAATDAAWERGVAGVPAVAVGDRVFYGDDQLDAAAQHLRVTEG